LPQFAYLMTLTKVKFDQKCYVISCYSIRWINWSGYKW